MQFTDTQNPPKTLNSKVILVSTAYQHNIVHNQRKGSDNQPAFQKATFTVLGWLQTVSVYIWHVQHQTAGSCKSLTIQTERIRGLATEKTFCT